jgi:hypothetical protein
VWSAVPHLTALRFSDEFVEHLSHQTRVPAHDCGGCRDVAAGVEVLPVEDKAGMAGELLEKGALGPAVALAERVDGVDLTEVVGQPLGRLRHRRRGVRNGVPAGAPPTLN